MHTALDPAIFNLSCLQAKKNWSTSTMGAGTASFRSNMKTPEGAQSHEESERNEKMTDCTREILKVFRPKKEQFLLGPKY